MKLTILFRNKQDEETKLAQQSSKIQDIKQTPKNNSFSAKEKIMNSKSKKKNSTQRGK